MTSQAFKDALLDVYRGEQFGEGFFTTLLEHAENTEQAFVLGTLQSKLTNINCCLQQLNV